MIVKCPQCSTGYSIPEHVITDKPKKMRCSRCKNVFTLMRRQDKAPSGYEEFTGAQHLPQEFAFLKTAPPSEEPQAESPPPFAQPIPAAAPAPPPAPEPAADEGEELADDDLEQDAEEPAAPAPPPPQPAHQPAPYVPAREQWEDEAPLELAVYALPGEQRSRGAQVFGKLVFVVLVLGILFFGYVLYRNEWSLSLSDLGGQISFAFSDKKFERIPREALSADVVVTSRKIVRSSAGESYLVVHGDVYNRAFTGLGRILLRARLLSGAGETAAEVRVPCGVVLDEQTISVTPKGAMPGHYRPEGKLYNCVISATGSSPFQVVFESLPADYAESTPLEIKSIYAQVAE